MYTNAVRWGALLRGAYLACAAIIVLTLSPGVLAQQANEVELRAGTIAVMPSIARGLLDIERQPRPAGLETLEEAEAPSRIIMQFADIPSAEVLEQLKKQGIRVLDYIGNNAYFATVEPQGFDTLREAAEEPQALPMVRGVAPVLSEYKQEKTVREHAVGEWAVEEDGTMLLRVEVWPDAPFETSANTLAQVVEEIVETLPDFNAMIVRVTPDNVDVLTSLNNVRWVEPVPPPFVEFNDDVRRNMRVNQVHAAPYNLRGSGVNIGIWDGGRVDPHDDFTGRLTIIDTGANISRHATHVAGTVGGSGARSQTEGGNADQWRGVAWEGQLLSSDFFGNVPNEVIQAIRNNNVHMTTNSWGYAINEFPRNNCNLYGDYDGTTRDFDSVVRGTANRAAIPVVFAAGNERDDRDCGMTTVPPFNNYAVVSPPGTAKNVITVGAINSNDNSMTLFSSWGPMDDGRLKPEVVAPGCQVTDDGSVTSTVPGNGYGTICGTSMATPATSGLVALLLEQYQMTYGTTPLPSTIKAVLVHTAQDLGPAGPDFSFGYGRIDAPAAVDAIRDRHVIEGSITSNGDVVTSQVQVPSNTTEVRITLTWDDVPATAGAARTLVNDLDVVLTDPNGQAHRPFVLNPAAPANPAGSGVDDINVVEQVLVRNPQQGTWRVDVQGTRIAQGPQSYSLVSTLQPPPPPEELPPILSVSGCSLCYTCGGDWPAFSGVIPTRQGKKPYERGSACSGSLSPTNDDAPYLCCTVSP